MRLGVVRREGVLAGRLTTSRLRDERIAVRGQRTLSRGTGSPGAVHRRVTVRRKRTLTRTARTIHRVAMRRKRTLPRSTRTTNRQLAMRRKRTLTRSTSTARTVYRLAMERQGTLARSTSTTDRRLTVRRKRTLTRTARTIHRVPMRRKRTLTGSTGTTRTIHRVTMRRKRALASGAPRSIGRQGVVRGQGVLARRLAAGGAGDVGAAGEVLAVRVRRGRAARLGELLGVRRGAGPAGGVGAVDREVVVGRGRLVVVAGERLRAVAREGLRADRVVPARAVVLGEVAGVGQFGLAGPARGGLGGDELVEVQGRGHAVGAGRLADYVGRDGRALRAVDGGGGPAGFTGCTAGGVLGDVPAAVAGGWGVGLLGGGSAALHGGAEVFHAAAFRAGGFGGGVPGLVGCPPAAGGREVGARAGVPLDQVGDADAVAVVQRAPSAAGLVGFGGAALPTWAGGRGAVAVVVVGHPGSFQVTASSVAGWLSTRCVAALGCLPDRVSVAEAIVRMPARRDDHRLVIRHGPYAESPTALIRSGDSGGGNRAQRAAALGGVTARLPAAGPAR